MAKRHQKSVTPTEFGERANPWGGRLAVALVYPNSYHHGMSNLGFQTVFHLLNSREDTLCERFFLPDASSSRPSPLLSCDSGKPLTDFDLVAFSLSFENDFIHIPQILSLAGIPVFRDERDEYQPLVVAGGVCAFLNPEPVADFFDLFVVGEAEPILPKLINQLVDSDSARPELLGDLSKIPGIYIPSLTDIRYNDDGTLAEIIPVEESGRTRRQWATPLNETESRTFVYSDSTEFSNMALTEISRGCSRGCRFCAAGYIYLPVRERSADALNSSLQQGVDACEKVGLVAAAVSDHSELPQINNMIESMGGAISVSSVRVDSLTVEAVDTLYRSGHRTVAIAPEAGSQRLRNLINKGLSQDQIVDAARMLGEGGMLNIKLYLLIGLPTETDEDIEEIIELAELVRTAWIAGAKEHGKAGTLTVSVNPFIPKPVTPLQWAGMAPAKLLERRVKYLRKRLNTMSNMRMICESVRSAQLQALLARGDRRLSPVIVAMSEGVSVKRACRDSGLDIDFYVTRERGENEILPWEVIDVGVKRDYLRAEYQRGLQEQLTPPCSRGCSRCGIC